jgi:hypothetical protein
MPAGSLLTLPLPDTVTDRFLVSVSSQPSMSNTDPIVSRIKQKWVQGRILPPWGFMPFLFESSIFVLAPLRLPMGATATTGRV